MTWLFVKTWFKVHRNVNDIRKQIVNFIKKHIIILFTHKSIHNSDRKGTKYRMSCTRWSTSLVVNKQFWSDQSAVDQNDTMRLIVRCDLCHYRFLMENKLIIIFLGIKISFRKCVSWLISSRNERFSYRKCYLFIFFRVKMFIKEISLRKNCIPL